MKNYGLRRFENEENGQALVIILLVIVISVIIALAITSRTIQDIKRTGEERASDSAGSQVESFLDVVTDPEIFDVIVSNDQYCQGNLEPVGHVCTLDADRLRQLLGGDPDWPCDESGTGPTVQVRMDQGVQGFVLGKDETMEINLEGQANHNFCLTWSGNGISYVSVKVYNTLSLLSASAVGSGAPGWPVYTSNSCSGGPNIAWPAGNDALYARVRPIGSAGGSPSAAASITITGVSAPQTASVRAVCNIGGVSREFVRTIQLKPSLPSAFDYVLFNKTGAVTKE